MDDISLGHHGVLVFDKDHWYCQGIQTLLGAVDVQVDGTRVDTEDISSRIVAVLQRISEIDREARAYLAANAPEDVKAAGTLVEPSLLFDGDAPDGTFVLFYSGSDEDDEMAYGVEFHEFKAFDLLIGD